MDAEEETIKLEKKKENKKGTSQTRTAFEHRYLFVATDVIEFLFFPPPPPGKTESTADECTDNPPF